MRAGSGEVEEHAVVAIVALKAADLGQADAVAIERDGIIQTVRMARDAQLQRPYRATAGSA